MKSVKKFLSFFKYKIIPQLREDIVKKISAIIIIIIIGIILFLWGGAFSFIKGFWTDWKSISKKEAAKIANKYIGSDAVEIIPFRNKDSELQYIAVLVNEGQGKTLSDLSEPKVFILEGSNGQYQIRDCEMQTSSFWMKKEEPIKSVFGVVDVDKDLNKEIYAIYGGHGNSGYSFDVVLLDTVTGEKYTVGGSADFSDPFPSMRFSENVPEKQGLSDWFSEKTKRLNMYSRRLSSESKAIKLWFEENGRGFFEGRVIIHEFTPDKNRGIDITVNEFCSVEDDNYKWISKYKGMVLGYNKSTKKYFVLLIPPSRYWFIEKMVIGKQYLWLDSHCGSVLAYDWKRQEFMSVRPDYSNMDIDVSDSLPEEYENNLSPFGHDGKDLIKLTAKGIFINNKKIAVKGVDMESEFKNAIESVD